MSSVLKTYVSHKRVRAAEITSVGNYRNGDDGKLVRSISLAGANTIELSEELFRRYVPVPGDFYVVYEDGYQSFSPRAAFLGGYTEVDDRAFADIKQEITRGKADTDQA